ncbi:DUF6286 domain-containing protein [Amycolatopsis sp. 195334CR]|uniref:DUF6286 domain-containing protein n=1 Tax=Amycolatopsis sp. 195334CR TaxID=2814588 RepID=UPI001A8EDD43|nr:DUF6286 domain-containing protein [Amycolatopsis sp. 195334CR]MBN6038498.1 hypothetical protein [Amycolatopsis sp. 195334CR]
MNRRPRRSLPATVTALILLAACVLVVITVVQRLTGDQPWLDYRAIATAVHATRWTDLTTALVAGTAATLGLVLLLAAILPGKRTVLALAGTPDSGAARAGYRSTLRAAAANVDGISRASVTVGSRRVKVRAKTARTQLDGLAEAVAATVEQRLDHVTPARRPTVSVKVRTTRESA